MKKFFKNKEYKGVSKANIILYFVLRAMVIIVLIRQAMLGNYENVALCFLTLFLFTVPYFIHRKFKIEIPDLMQGIILVFIFSAEILGEIQSYYVNYAHWDTILHTVTGFLAAAVGFALTDLFNTSSSKIKLSPFYLAIVSFCFSLSVGVVWELFEYNVDRFMNKDMQKDRIITTVSTVTLDPLNDNNVVVIDDIEKTVIYSKDGDNTKMNVIEGGYLDVGIHDTMKDLFVTFIGAITFSVFGALYVKNRDKYKFVEKFTVKKMSNE